MMRKLLISLVVPLGVLASPVKAQVALPIAPLVALPAIAASIAWWSMNGYVPNANQRFDLWNAMSQALKDRLNMTNNNHEYQLVFFLAEAPPSGICPVSGWAIPNANPYFYASGGHTMNITLPHVANNLNAFQAFRHLIEYAFQSGCWGEVNQQS